MIPSLPPKPENETLRERAAEIVVGVKDHSLTFDDAVEEILAFATSAQQGQKAKIEELEGVIDRADEHTAMLMQSIRELEVKTQAAEFAAKTNYDGWQQEIARSIAMEKRLLTSPPLLNDFAKAIATVHVNNDYRSMTDDFVLGNKQGIAQAFRIAKTVLESCLASERPSPQPADAQQAPATPFQERVIAMLKYCAWLYPRIVKYDHEIEGVGLLDNHIKLVRDAMFAYPQQGQHATPQQVREACAQVADRAAVHDEEYAARYADEANKYYCYAHRAKTIATSIRALIPNPVPLQEEGDGV